MVISRHLSRGPEQTVKHSRPRFKTGIILIQVYSNITTSCCSLTRMQLGHTYHCTSILRHEGILYVGNLNCSSHFCREGNGPVTSARQDYWWVLCDIMNVVSKEKIQMAFLGVKDLVVQL